MKLLSPIQNLLNALKKFFITLATAIRRGILSIFPLPFTLEQAVIVIVGGTLLGCSSTRQLTTQLVHDIHTDTVYLSNTQYDSIYIYKDKLTDRTRDTIYIKDISVEYRYKMLRDTIYKVQHDSIPYEVTVIETKELTRPLTWYDHLTRLTFWFVFGYLISIIAFKLKTIISNH